MSERPREIYLDHAATTPLLPCAKRRMLEVMEADFANASSLHARGRRARQAVEEAREYVARLIGAEPEEIIFTSGGSEANNLVAETFRGQKVAVSAIEHPSVLEAMRTRADELEILPVDEWGFLRSKPSANCDLISVMMANNEVGALALSDDAGRMFGALAPLARSETKRASTLDAKNARPVNLAGAERRSEACFASSEATPKILSEAKFTGAGVGCVGDENASECYVHSDATQALGKIQIDVKQLNVDYLTISAHKIGGPVGVGALYVKKGAPLTPLILGGHQEHGLRAGTSNAVAIAGFGAAAKWCQKERSVEKWAEVAKLRDELAERILSEIPGSTQNSPHANCLPNILNVSFRGAEGESIQLYLDAEGICVGTGSACAAGDIRPSHVLMATKGDAEVAHGSVRFSLGLETTRADIDRVMQVLPGIIAKLQGMSTIKMEEKHERK